MGWKSLLIRMKRKIKTKMMTFFWTGTIAKCQFPVCVYPQVAQRQHSYASPNIYDEIGVDTRIYPLPRLKSDEPNQMQKMLRISHFPCVDMNQKQKSKDTLNSTAGVRGKKNFFNIRQIIEWLNTTQSGFFNKTLLYGNCKRKKIYTKYQNTAD